MLLIKLLINHKPKNLDAFGWAWIEPVLPLRYKLKQERFNQ